MFNLFNKSIRVELIEALSNDPFGMTKLLPEQLPASFEKRTTIHIEGADWVVERAEPLTSAEFTKSRRLKLWLTKILPGNTENVRYSLPTISNELPAMSDSRSYYDYTLMIEDDDWRQVEFLPFSLVGDIEEEMKQVDEILFPESDPGFDSRNGFDRIHIRKRIGRFQLNIPVEEFLELIRPKQSGCIEIRDYAGYILDGFSLKTDMHTYYGTIKDDYIKELCLDFFESIDDEIDVVLEKYNLLLVTWCRGNITGSAY